MRQIHVSERQKRTKVHSLHFSASIRTNLTHVNVYSTRVHICHYGTLFLHTICRIIDVRKKGESVPSNALFASFDPPDVVHAKRYTSRRDAHVVAQLSSVNNPLTESGVRCSGTVRNWKSGVGVLMSVTEERIQELNRRFLDFMSKTENVDTATKEIYEDLLDEVLMGFVFDVHRTTKTGSSDIEEGIPDDESYAIVDSPGLDVFGQHPVKKSQECNCPNCERSVAACIFANHLAKCIGMGRNSSRIASLRIANNSKDLNNYGGVLSDNDDDVDWSLTNDSGSKRKRPRKDRNGVSKRSGKQQKQQGSAASSSGSSQRNGETTAIVSGSGSVHNSNENSPSNYENMSLVDKRALLTQICGVVSEHTKKLCTRSIRCPQHTDDQRKEVRANLDSTSGSNNQDNLHVDVDTYEESEGQNLRDTLARWDREGSSHSSPADSASTTSTSSISRKRETKSKGKGKASSKRDRGSPISQGD